ncbi:extracellular serine/threonine protein kinase FAM20C-like [Sinocyclocheilus rhinocerous]|uniref:extracellular serine/threonine protein kinase FAM20C-like n=1 Tax=Sinocyclocheilus rhinocerous TaxID=307959 RepID=UPI0007B920C5|nr:PREDICTED: extracellular serine/threonine protein kinase FAM20C-like [Sinocyclocheilus rhinocerous]
MRVCARRRSRTLRLWLLIVFLSLHLLVVSLVLSIYHTSCELHSYPGIQTSISFSVQNASASTSTMTAAGSDTQEVEMDGTADDLAKLEALYSHPLYNLPTPPLPDGDWLLKVRTEKKERERSTQQWLSANEDDYDPILWNASAETHPPWLRFHLGISRWQMYQHKDPNLSALTQQMASHRIVSAVQKSGGTQLKLVMSFPNYGQTLFKPMKQERHEETNVNLYYFSDFERHNAEIAAFHLDKILGFRRVPPVVGRLVNVIKEIKDITTDHKLVTTFFTSPVGNACFYGQCSYYCSTEHAICGRPLKIEGSMAAMLPDLSLAPRRSWRSPWRRSYSRSKLAQWETDSNYCDSIKKTPPYDRGTRLVDLIDMSILDFLMSNMDRHHYETFEKFGNDTFLIHFDNGRAFGRHSNDEPSILAPLVQCCRVRRSTLLRLHLLSLQSYRMSDVMRASLSQDPLAVVAPLLTEQHLSALDRRLETVIQTIQDCLQQHQHHSDVIHDDIGDYPGA